MTSHDSPRSPAHDPFAPTLTRLRAAPLVVATHNMGKVRELSALLATLGLEGEGAADLALAEPEETEATFEGNALLKARAAAAATRRWAIADDSGVCVDALDGEPGIFTAGWAGEPRDWRQAMERVQRELALRGAHQPPARGASFVCALALAGPGGESLVVQGRVPGTLVWPPRGELGAGFEPMFVPEGHTRTYGQMQAEERAAINHRALAFRALAAALAGTPDASPPP